MSENTLIIAAAGSGKTTYLVNEAMARDGKVLILTYTISNEDVIKRRLIQKAGCIPQNITVKTWFSFLLQHGVKPYQGSIHDSMFDYDIQGMILVNEKSGIRYQTGRHPVYWKESNVDKHYFSKSNKIYSDKISKFVFKCNTQSGGAVIRRLARLYDNIFIDEVQDLAGYDLELIKLLFSSSISVLLVGDPRQVTYLTHLEQKHSNYQNGKIRDFVENKLERNTICNIDESTLKASHRCCESICKYASQLYPDMPEATSCSCCNQSSADHQGVFLIKPEQIQEYTRKYSVTQLRWDRKSGVLPSVPVMNFGEAKGKTFDRVLIYPTKDMSKWVEDSSTSLPDASRAKFYVAITRARYSVAIVLDYDSDRSYEGVDFVSIL